MAREAAAAGVACVVSDTGGLAETVIQGETGIRVPAGDSDALARALLSVLGCREHAAALGAAAQLHARRHFSSDLATDRFRQIYSEIGRKAR